MTAWQLPLGEKGRKRLVLTGEVILAAGVSLVAAASLTWPSVLHLDEVIIGSGELGGWLWRYWWHFMEVDALAASDLGLLEKITLFFSLGRYPETGNILDVLLLSYPLQQFLDLPTHYNAKVFLILVGDGMLGYLLARTLTPSRTAAMAAATVAVINPINMQDLYGSGLRQVTLWWVLLLPVLLMRVERSQRMMHGVAVGVCFALCAGFYWFYGLFAAMFLLIWGIHYAWRRRGTLQWRRVARWMLPMMAAAVAGVLLFFVPYMQAPGGAATGAGAASALPELSFFLRFPDYDVIKDVPLRPATYSENVLSSLNRTIRSSWSLDYPVNPTYFRALSVVVFLFGVLPALLSRGKLREQQRFWLLVWVVFFLGTLGPFLKIGGGQDSSEVLVLGEAYVVRMPYTWMFQWIPGMSRMFAPYRMGSWVVVASVALLGMGLSQIPSMGRLGAWPRRFLALACIPVTLLLTNYRFEIGPVPDDAFQPDRWRPPVKVSAIRVPDFYLSLDQDELQGIVEMPLEQQQDLLYLYQVFHHWKVYRGWATPPAIPPVFRAEGGGEAGERMRYLSQQDHAGRQAGDLLLRLSRTPQEVDLDEVSDEQFAHLFLSGNYRYLVVHERGYYLVDPLQGPLHYADVVRRLALRLGTSAEQVVEHEWFDYPGNEYQVPDGPVYIPWSSQEVNLPDRQMPSRYFMAIFDLGPFLESYTGPPPPPKEETPLSTGDSTPAPEAHEHVVVPPPQATGGQEPVEASP